MKSKVLVVGASGFIGGALADYLTRYFDVLRLNSRHSWERIENQNLKFNSISRVFWCASAANPVQAEYQPELVLDEIRSLQKLVSQITSDNSREIPKVIFLSSAGCTYSSNVLPFRETSTAQGTNAYGRMKVKQEELLRASGIPHLILRIGNVYGPGQIAGRGQGLIANLIEKLLRHESIEIFGELSSTRDYVYISDVIRAIFGLSLESEGVFNIGSGSRTSIKDLLGIFESICGYSFSINRLEQRVTDRDSYCLDISKIKSEINWIPEMDLLNGIKSTIETWRFSQS